MRLPVDCKLRVEDFYFDGLIRPKHYLAVYLENQTHKLCFVRYVRSFPWFLGLRLFLAVIKLKQSVRKYKRFANLAGL